MRQDASTSSERFPLDTVLIRIAASEEHFHALSYSLLWGIFHLFKNVQSQPPRVGGEGKVHLKMRM